MNADEKIVAEIRRIEVDSTSGKVYIVFEVIDPVWKKDIKIKWADNDIEYKVINTSLVIKE